MFDARDVQAFPINLYRERDGWRQRQHEQHEPWDMAGIVQEIQYENRGKDELDSTRCA